MKKKVLGLVLFSIMLILIACGKKEVVPEEPTISQVEDTTEDSNVPEAQETEEDQEKQEFLESVNFVREKLDRTVGVNEKLSEEDRNQLFDDLIAQIEAGTIDDEGVYFGLKSIIAKIGCAHLNIWFSGLNPFKKTYLPISCEWRQEGYVITFVNDSNIDLLGCVVTEINGYTPEEIAQLYCNIYPQETESGARMGIADCNLYNCDLAFTGIIQDSDTSVTVSVIRPDQTKEDVTVDLYGFDGEEDFHSIAELMDDTVEIPLRYRIKAESNYAYYTYYADPDHRTMYFQYNVADTMTTQTLASMFQEMMDIMQEDDDQYEIFILDLSWNFGGNRYLLQELLGKYAEYLNTKCVAVITGGNTFSAGAQAVDDCYHYFSDVKVYGETTGNAIHNYTEIVEYAVPNNDMTLVLPTVLDYNPNLEAHNEDIMDGGKPDVELLQSNEDYLNGIDTIYEYIIHDVE